MKDKRIKWINTRFACGLSVFFMVIFSLILIFPILYFFIPEALIPLPTIFGINMSEYLIIDILFFILACGLGILIYFDTPIYNEYIKSELFPFAKELDNEIVFFIDDKEKSKIIIEWKENIIWKDILYIKNKLEFDSNYIFFIGEDKNKTSIKNYIMNKKYIDEKVLLNINSENNSLEGYFTFVKDFHRDCTIYGIKYLGKNKGD